MHAGAGGELDLTVRGRRIHAQRFGSRSAPLLLGLPGLSGNIRSFEHLGERIAGEARQVVALDWRGRGHSDHTSPGSYGWEHHALDVLGVADALGGETFSAVGLSMGASVAMKVAELAPARLDAVVLIDVAGRVDPGFGDVIATAISRLGEVYESPDAYVDSVRSLGLISPWSDHWERVHRYELEVVDGGVRARTSTDAVAEDRAYTASQDPYRRWEHLTMPTLLVRATQEVRPGSGFAVPPEDRDLFLERVARGEVVEVDATHLSISAHPETAAAINRFLRDVPGR